MAITGIGLLLYVLAHMIGNLKMFQGAYEGGEYAIDLYGEALRSLGGDLVPHESILWLFRIGLFLAFVIHIGASAALTKRNWDARGTSRYEAQRHYAAANYASRTMRWGGIIILLFLLYHLADLTFGWANPDFVYGNVYDNVIASLTRPPVAILYLVAQVALAFHIFHGAWSLFQSLGFVNPRYNVWRRYFAIAFAIAIFVGNTAIVLGVWTGAVS
jgi:succinate dehydrogenase / fumarate reductase cytochrome b subunit